MVDDYDDRAEFTPNDGVDLTDEDAIGSDNLDAWLDIE